MDHEHDKEPLKLSKICAQSGAIAAFFRQHTCTNRMLLPPIESAVSSPSLLFLSLCFQASCLCMCTPTRTQAHTRAHTRPSTNVSQYLTFSTQKCQCLGQSLSAFLVSPTSLAVCLCAFHLNLLSLPDISHARGSQDKLNISKVCHKRLEVHYGMKVIKYKQHFVVS